MRALLPQPIEQVDDDYLLSRYAGAALPFVRFNFVSSADGSAQLGGLSGALGSNGDHRIFNLLRRLAHVVLVGSGTVRAEGYAGPLVSDADQAWRTAHGLDAHPVFAIVSHNLSIAPDAEVLTASPGPVLLYTCAQVAEPLRESYPEHVQLVQVADNGEGPDPVQIVADLDARGLQFIHAEGGPHIFGQFISAGQVDSLCVSYSPVLAAGAGSRIARSVREQQRSLRLHTLLEENSMLFAEYRVDR